MSDCEGMFCQREWSAQNFCQHYGDVTSTIQNERKIKSSEIPFGIDGYVGWRNFGQIELLRCGVFLSDVSAKKRDDTKAVSTKSKVVKVRDCNDIHPKSV